MKQELNKSDYCTKKLTTSTSYICIIGREVKKTIKKTESHISDDVELQIIIILFQLQEGNLVPLSPQGNWTEDCDDDVVNGRDEEATPQLLVNKQLLLSDTSVPA